MLSSRDGSSRAPHGVNGSARGATSRSTAPQVPLQSTAFVASLFPALKPELRAVHRGILEVLDTAPHAGLLREFFTNGKLFRPLLTLVGAGAVGGDPARAVELAQAIELLHGASLIHDDIIDDADTRRGKRSIPAVLSRDVALVLGDYLILRAIERIASIRSADDANILAAMRLVTPLVSRCCSGQIDEIEASGRNVDEATYVSIVTNKTGALFATSLAGGGVIAGASPERIEILTTLGDQLGVVFQIYDDVLDLGVHERDLGKPVGNSLAMQRPHVAGVYMAEAGLTAAATRADVAAYVHEHGLMQRIQALQDRYVRAAEATIARLPSSRYADGLRALTHHLTSWAEVTP